MDPEAAISLIDYCWFNLEILNKRSNPSSSSSSEANPDHKLQENGSESNKFQNQLVDDSRSKPDLLSFNSSYNSDSFSPISVLESVFQTKKLKKGNIGTRTRRRKSLSELEFQELKGFMDLGFEFSEEDVNSSLVEIIPGLQNLGKKSEETEENSPDKTGRARPYLSEAWEAMGKEKKKNNGLMYWRIPAINDEVDMKDSLKWWAHTVASAVRS